MKRIISLMTILGCMTIAACAGDKPASEHHNQEIRENVHAKEEPKFFVTRVGKGTCEVKKADQGDFEIECPIAVSKLRFAFATSSQLSLDMTLNGKVVNFNAAIASDNKVVGNIRSMPHDLILILVDGTKEAFSLKSDL